MSQFALSWELCRKRLIDTISDLDKQQLNWKIYPECLSIGEMCIHVAGVEVSFASQLLGLELDAEFSKLRATASDGVANDKPFPFSADEITPELVQRSFESAKGIVEPVVRNPSQELLQKEIVSALGPIITGEAALARLAFHPGYHQGQAYLIRTSPEFARARR